MTERGVILNLGISDAGGAGRGALDLHIRFRDMGFESFFVVLEKTSNDEHVIEIPRWARMWRKIKRAFSPRSGTDADYQFYGLDEQTCYVSVDTILSCLPRMPQVINMFWTSTFINTRTVRDLHRRTGAEVVWHLPDMAPFTGGCHFSLGCLGYEKDCRECPAVNAPGLRNRPADNLELKRQHLADVPITVVGGTTDILKRASQSTVFRELPVELLGFYCDESLFQAGDKWQARRAMLDEFKLMIPDDARIALVGTTSFGQRRKGARELEEALRVVSGYASPAQPLHVISCGGSLPFASVDGVKIHQTGLVSMRQLSALYKGVDFLINPVVDDIGPFMVVEAMYSGTPVVSFPVGIANDVVVDGKTGVRTAEVSGHALAEGIRSFAALSPERRRQMGYAARKVALEFFNWEVRECRYGELFDRLVEIVEAKEPANENRQ